MNLAKPVEAITPRSFPRAFAAGVLVFILLVALSAFLGANVIWGLCSGGVGAIIVMWRKLSPPKVAVTWADCVTTSTTTVMTPLSTDKDYDYDRSLLKEIDDAVTDAGYMGIFEEHP